MSARIYAEGGGPGQLYDSLFRAAWKEFFQSAGLAGRLPRVIRGEGRSQTFDLFITAVQTHRAGEVPFLLVDSEDPVQAGHSVWQHLKARDNWDKPEGVSNDHAFLMVQVMETWLIADRELLRNYFGGALREQHLPHWPALEAVSKPTIFAALNQATAGCSKPYAKGKVSYELLSKLNPALVETACPYARKMLDKLRTLA